ncbi:fatty acid desaturase [Cyanobacteria bacterium FACHB-63]|nr:fatty acid desaturase [Cyanobacteria bacterium FACHB-63]
MSQMLFILWLAVTWNSHPLESKLLLGSTYLFLFWYNALVVTHNFVHTPWFRAKWLNRMASIVNSINLFVPALHYRYLHLNHHQYENDRKDATGRTLDGSSTFAYGKDEQSEHVLSYCLLSLLRDDLRDTVRQANHSRETAQLWIELTACFVSSIAYLLISWQFFVFCLLPVFYFGWCLAYLSNYYEHYGAIPEQRYANSASHYGRIYNWLCCNEGYHQEHHLRPNVHWSRRPQIYKQMQAELENVDRVILTFPHPLGFLHHRGKTKTPTKQPVLQR